MHIIMNSKFFLAAATASALFFTCIGSAQAQSGKADAGRQKAQNCAICHGANGMATAPDAPNLAGQNAFYTESALKAYRSGTRKHEVMAVMAKPLSDQDIADLAAWYAAIKVEATAPN